MRLTLCSHILTILHATFWSLITYFVFSDDFSAGASNIHQSRKNWTHMLMSTWMDHLNLALVWLTEVEIRSSSITDCIFTFKINVIFNVGKYLQVMFPNWHFFSFLWEGHRLVLIWNVITPTFFFSKWSLLSHFRTDFSWIKTIHIRMAYPL